MNIQSLEFGVGVVAGMLIVFIPYLLASIFKPKKKYDLSALNKITANIEINLKNAYGDVEKLAGYFKELENG